MRFLSPEHIAALQAALDRSEEVAELKLDEPLQLQYHVTDAPDGATIDYSVALETGKARVALGALPAPQFTFTMSYDTAMKLAREELNPTTAFATRKVKVDGSMLKLAKVGGPLSAVNDVIQEVPFEA